MEAEKKDFIKAAESKGLGWERFERERGSRLKEVQDRDAVAYAAYIEKTKSTKKPKQLKSKDWRLKTRG